jgi:superfamily II DNA/RNA helicase
MLSLKSSFYDDIAIEIIDSNRFKEAYLRLLKLQKIGQHVEKELIFKEIKFLLNSASIFSFCNNEKFKQYSYKIAAILSERYSSEYENLSQAIQYIMICSGHLPVIKKIVDDGNLDYFSMYTESKIPFNPFIFKNILIKQSNNIFETNNIGMKLYFTDFQSKSFKDLCEGKSISISAPTSAGKSFLLVAYLSQKFQNTSKLNVVYIVPTRALITQVLKDIKSELKSFAINDIFIISSSNGNFHKIPKKIFVLTQERYHNLLFDDEFTESIDILIVDEAQKVSDESRGILLEEVIEETITRYPNVQKIFLSPFSKNPEKFAKMFKLSDLESEKTILSPVSQNLLKLDINDSNFSLMLSTQEFEDVIQLQKGAITNQDRSEFSTLKNWKLLWAAKKFGDEFNIVYCNTRKECVNSAVVLSEILPDHINENNLEAIRFLEDYIHKDYYLIKCLKKGVAYHHGKMPTHIRNIVEDLLRNKNLKYLFCTSTLLEGVNLPVRNIFIYKPKIGKRAINNLNFWNLAGRAGRLLKDYYGNIYCINVSEWKGYEPDPNDVEHTIESILEEVLISKNQEIIDTLKNLYTQLKLKNQPIEQAITKFIIQSLKKGDKDFIENLIERNPNFEVDKLKAIKEEIQKIANSINISAELIQKNSSINPIKQQELFEKFSIASEHVPIPNHPNNFEFYTNLCNIYQAINQFFLQKKREDKSHIYFGTLTTNWINEKSFPELIKFKLSNVEKKTKLTESVINDAIDELFENLNDDIMFNYQKYLKCYIDILSYQYEKDGFDSNKICKNLPLFIEYGTYRPNTIMLQSVGISRNTALLINPMIAKTFADENDCLTWIKKHKDLLKEKIHPILYREIEKIL